MRIAERNSLISDNPDNFEDFVEDVDVHEDTFTRKRSNSKKVQNDGSYIQIRKMYNGCI